MLKHKQWLIVCAVLLGTAAAIAGVYAVTTKYLDNQTVAARPAVAACPVHGTVHHAAFRHGVVAPRTTAARRCDTLIITNEDDQIRLVAFGPHDHHEPYDGVTEKILSQRQSLTIVLDQAGSYSFHDYLDDNAIGYFTLAP